jgi:transcriptional regulator with XRE-family HTH domain
LREVRVRAGWSQRRLAGLAGVSDATVRMFEANPDAIADDAKRDKLTAIYRDLSTLVA